MIFPSEVFRAYDIRGLVGDQLTEEFAFHLGCAVGTTLLEQDGKTMILGRDCRPSGIALSASLAKGLNSVGVDVIDIGVVPTPVVYWSIQHLQVDGGIALTGSHNPAGYNGFKITMSGQSVHGDAVQALHQRMSQEDYRKGTGTTRVESVLEPYVDELASGLRKPERALKIVVDAGNGVGGLTAVPLLERLGVTVVPLFCELDGTFPNHHADPTVEKNLEDLKKEISRVGADLGFAFDGDADRIGVVDGNGRVLWGDELMIVLSAALLREEPGACIIGEVKCSKVMYDAIASFGGRPIMWKAGHSLIKAKMKEEKAALAGEMSGHIFYKHRYYGFDDATYAAGRLVEIMGDTPGTLDDYLKDIPKTVSTPEIRMDCSEELKFKLVAATTEAFRRRAETEDFGVVDIDGVRVEWEDGWGLVRCSNTQPILVLRFEAKTQERLNEIQATIESEIEHQRSVILSA